LCSDTDAAKAKCEAIDLAERFGEGSHVDTVDKTVCAIP